MAKRKLRSKPKTTISRGRAKKATSLSDLSSKKLRRQITKKAPPGKGSSAKRKPSQAYRGKKKGLSRSRSALKRASYR
ncbi:hypothetical protein LCGC14_1150170 [marine sediment metagenome]|uniref:Uncharacterized protein n=1 Tax=marine sediment metagenome TaxID=412755 RepID=A0A0F9LVR4_9ZZZZ